MKRIALEIFALIVFLVIIFMALEFLFRDYRNAVDHVMDDFFKKKKSADVLLVGNSHTVPFYYSLRGDDNSNVACLTIAGDDLFWMQALVKRQLREMPRARYVLLNCDDELLGFNQSLSGLKYMNRILYQYADTMYGNKFTDILLSKSNFFRSNRDIGYLINKPANENIMIANTMTGSPGFTDEECKARAIEISDKRFHQKLFTENLGYLESIIGEVKRSGCKLFILKMPKCDCLKASVVEQNLAASRQKLDSIFAAGKVEVLDFTSDSSFHRNDYGNPDHLTPAAAHRLLQKVNERIFAACGEYPMNIGR